MIKYNNYFASELEKHAMAITQYQHPCTIQLGDVNNIDVYSNRFCQVDLLLAGSPCTSFSVAGKRDGFKAESGQNSVRMYITNIPFDPSKIKDEGIVLADILEEDGIANPLMTNKDGKSHCLTARYNGAVWWNSIERKQRTMVQIGETAEIKGHDILKRVYSPSGKSPTLNSMGGGNREPKVATFNPKGGRIVNRRLDKFGVRKDNQLEIPFTEKIEVREDNKTNCLTTIQKDNIVVDDLRWRKLLVTEMESLQTLPRDYTSMGRYQREGEKSIAYMPVAKSNRMKAIGNGWTVSIINEIFKGIDGDLRDVMSMFDGISCGQQALKTTERS